MSDSLWPSWTAAPQASLSVTISLSLLKLMPIESVMSSNHLILCHPLLPPPSIFPSIRVFSIESALYIRWPKYWSFSFNITPSNEYSGFISLSIDWSIPNLQPLFSHENLSFLFHFPICWNHLINCLSWDYISLFTNSLWCWQGNKLETEITSKWYKIQKSVLYRAIIKIVLYKQ